MCFKKKPKPPTDFPLFDISWSDMKANLMAVGINCQLKDRYIPDGVVHYTDEESWAKIVPFLTYPAEYYIAHLDIDCDDYSKWAAADASKLFRLNYSCLQVWGYMPDGYHAFNLVVAGPRRFLLFEPNAGFLCAGELFNLGDNDYWPGSWK